MDHERWRRLEELYNAARSLPAGARAQFLAGECRGDESLRSEVESLIAQPDHTWAAPGRPGVASHEEILGRRIGHYDVQRLLGAGGMGRVYRARDTRLGRDVALKLLPPEWTSDPDRLSRLDREARLLASLNHPNIATIHGVEDAGRHPRPGPRIHRGRHARGSDQAGSVAARRGADDCPPGERRAGRRPRTRHVHRLMDRASTRLDRRRRPSAMAGGRAGAAVHRRGSSVDVCFRRVRRHLQGRITQTTLCIVFDQGAQFLRGRLRARRGRIDLLAVPRKWQCTRSRHGHRRLAGGTSHRGQVSSRPAWIRRMT